MGRAKTANRLNVVEQLGRKGHDCFGRAGQRLFFLKKDTRDVPVTKSRPKRPQNLAIGVEQGSVLLLFNATLHPKLQVSVH